jgi:hypothetical protein
VAMTLEQWHAEMTPRLDKIEAGALMALRNAERLPTRPPFYTRAEAALRDCEAVLAAALDNVRGALAAIESKEIDR